MAKEINSWVDIEIDKDHKVSFAKAYCAISINGEIIYEKESSGSAVRNKDDKNDEEIAVNLAVARALSNLARSIDRRAWGMVKHNDELKVPKKKATLKQTKKQRVKEISSGKVKLERRSKSR